MPEVVCDLIGSLCIYTCTVREHIHVHECTCMDVQCVCICSYAYSPAVCQDRVEAAATPAKGGKVTIGGFPIVDRVMRNNLPRLGRAPVDYLCLLWRLTS